MSTREEIIEVTKKLIVYETTKDNPQAMKDSLHFVKTFCKKNSLKYKEVSKNNSTSLVISKTLQKNKQYDYLLHGHIDVVPALKEQFVPKVVSNKIYGRGALDMKGGLAALLVLMKSLSKSKSTASVCLMVTSDEETGGEYGSKYLFDALKYRGNFYITAEGEKDYLLKYKQKGVLMLKLKVTDRGGHAAYTWTVKNPITQLYLIYQDFEKLFSHKKDPLHWYTTINVGTIKGGMSTNSIPDEAELTIDIRFANDWQTPQKIMTALKKILKKYPNASLSILYQSALMDTDKHNHYLQLLNTISKRELKTKKDLFFQNHGTNDARYAANKGIPAVGFGPIGNHYHAKDEFVYIDSLEKYHAILLQLLETN